MYSFTIKYILVLIKTHKTYNKKLKYRYLIQFTINRIFIYIITKTTKIKKQKYFQKGKYLTQFRDIFTQKMNFKKHFQRFNFYAGCF